MPDLRVDLPFTAGMYTDDDIPSYNIPIQASTFAQDLIATRGVARQRRGFKADETVGNDTIDGIWKADFELANTEDVFVTTQHTGSWIHLSAAGLGTNIAFTLGVSKFGSGDVFAGTNSGGTGIPIANWAVSNAATPGGGESDGYLIPRCFYEDELYFTQIRNDDQDHKSYRVLRFGGAAASTAATHLGGNSATFVGTTSQVIGDAGTGTWDSGRPLPGEYFVFQSKGLGQVRMCARIKEGINNGTFTLQNHRRIDTGNESILISGHLGMVRPVGIMFPSVSVGDTVTGTTTSGKVHTHAQEWLNDNSSVFSAVLQYSNEELGTSYLAGITSGSGAGGTFIHVGGMTGQSTVQPTEYQLMHAPTFQDMEVHKGSLWGANQWYYHESRVYVYPPGHIPDGPPGFSLPFDMSVGWYSTNPNDFIADFIDVPDRTSSGDQIVAIRSFGDFLGVMKQESLHAIFGTYPDFSQQKLADGFGCIDTRSAWALSSGVWWAGREGIYSFQGGQPVDVTAGRINRQWRNHVRDFDITTGDVCWIGEVFDHVIVTATVGGTTKTFVFDLARKTWISEFSNMAGNAAYSTVDQDDGDEMYFAVGSNAQVLRAGPMFFDADSSPSDAIQPSSGFAPQLMAYSTNNLSGDYAHDSRLRDCRVEANILTSTGTSTYVDVKHRGGGSFDETAPGTNLERGVGTLWGDAVDRIDHHHFRQLNYKGRVHELRFETGTVTPETEDIEIASFTINVAGRRTRA